MNSLATRDGPAALVAAARSLGFPRLEVPVPGRRWSIPVEPTPEAWTRFAGWFALDAEAIHAAMRELVSWDLYLRGQVVNLAGTRRPR